ncbi:MAG: TraB/GumN family protein, partial [Sphingomicrobium sp.]
MVGFLIAALLASAPATAPVAVQVLPQAKPAMWVVQDEDTVVYLFGTFHALDGRTHWFNNDVRAAFSSADELVLEAVVPDRSRLGAIAAPGYRPESLSLGRAQGASFV